MSETSLKWKWLKFGFFLFLPALALLSMLILPHFFMLIVEYRNLRVSSLLASLFFYIGIITLSVIQFQITYLLNSKYNANWQQFIVNWCSLSLYCVLPVFLCAVSILASSSMAVVEGVTSSRELFDAAMPFVIIGITIAQVFITPWTIFVTCMSKKFLTVPTINT